jgi:hypothetical protein
MQLKGERAGAEAPARKQRSLQQLRARTAACLQAAPACRQTGLSIPCASTVSTSRRHPDADAVRTLYTIADNLVAAAGEREQAHQQLHESTAGGSGW